MKLDKKRFWQIRNYLRFRLLGASSAFWLDKTKLVVVTPEECLVMEEIYYKLKKLNADWSINSKTIKERIDNEVT